MKKIFRKIWGIWVYLNLVLMFFVLYPLFFIFLSRPQWYHLAHALRGFWGKWVLFFGGMRFKIIYEAPLEKDATYIITPNHSSYLDILGVCVMLPINFNFMAKAELGKVPLFGIFFRTIDISVDRKSNIDAHRSYSKVSDQLTTEGRSIVIFPEGTIHARAPKLSPFKNGSFKLAIEQQVPILPITFVGNAQKLPDDGSYTSEPGTMYMYVHRAIDTTGLKQEDIPDLKKKVFAIIESKLENHEG